VPDADGDLAFDPPQFPAPPQVLSILPQG